LNRIGALLPFVEVEPPPPDEADVKTTAVDHELLTRLERGDATVDDVVSQLQNRSG
jgi:hypothetical protein